MNPYAWLLKKYQKRQIDVLRNKGAHIGNGVVVFSPRKTYIDDSRAWMLSIGDYTKITSGVIILTHDYSLSVLRRKYGEWIGEGRKTVIGSNCFIGMNSVLLMGTKIGNNCIVGAGSVLRGEYPNDSIIIGNPAKVVMSLDDYYQKRKLKSLDEAIITGREFVNTFHRKPKPKDMSSFKWLFTPRKKEILREYELDSFFCNGDEPDEVESAFYSSTPHWNDFNDFLEEVDRGI